MTLRLKMAALALALSVQNAFAMMDGKTVRIISDISNSINGTSSFTIFDDVSASVENGVVTLTGKVTAPYKRDDIEKRAATVDGVTRVVNRIDVLPVSTSDDELRYRIARSIYGNSNFVNYAVMASPPIHIVVEGGRVTLTGVVQSEVDRMLARSLATQFGVMSVRNELKTAAEVRQELDRS